MKQANGTGSVYKLSGSRRKPYVAMVTVKTEYDEEKDNYILKRKALGYFKTQTEARKCLAEYNSNKYDSDMIGITFDGIWQKILPDLEKQLSGHRMDSMQAVYGKYFELLKNQKITDIRTQHLQRCFDDCTKKSSTKDVMKAICNKVFDYALQNDLVSKNYTSFVKYNEDEVTIDRTLFDSEYICGLLSAPFKHEDAVTVILCYTGLRVRELLNNTVDNLDLENRLLYVPESLAKNKSSIRYVPIHEDIVPLLEQFVSFGNKNICGRTPKTKMCYQNYYEYLKKLGHTPHDTRHTFITRARECGMDALILQRIVGHTSKTITEKVYTHISNDELLKEISKINYEKQ